MPTPIERIRRVVAGWPERLRGSGTIVWVAGRSPADLDALVEVRRSRLLTLSALAEQPLGDLDDSPVLLVPGEAGVFLVEPMSAVVSTLDQDLSVGGRTVTLYWNDVTARCEVVAYRDGRHEATVDLVMFPSEGVSGTFGPMSAAIDEVLSELPGEPDDPEDTLVVALRAAEVLTGRPWTTSTFDGQHTAAVLDRREVAARADVIKGVEDHPALADPVLRSILAGDPVEALRPIAREAAHIAARLEGIADEPEIADALRVLREGSAPDGDPVRRQSILASAAERRARVDAGLETLRQTQKAPAGYFELFWQLKAINAVAGAFHPDAGTAAVSAVSSARSVASKRARVDDTAPWKEHPEYLDEQAWLVTMARIERIATKNQGQLGPR